MTHDNSELQLALLNESYATITSCKLFKDQKNRCVDRAVLNSYYMIREPYESFVENLFVPFSSPFVDKFQSKEIFFYFNYQVKLKERETLHQR